MDHTAIVTRLDGSKRYITQHTTDRKDADLQVWFDNNYRVYGWEMDNANRTPSP